METLSIIIPVNNEEKAISGTLALFRDLLEKHPEIEVIFVDDGSTDHTLEILQSQLDSRMKLIIHQRNKGYGAALKSGVKAASHDYIAITDADGSYPSERLLELFQIQLREGADMIVGLRTGEVVRTDFIRRVPKFFVRKLAEYLSGNEIPDLNSGLRIIRKELILNSLRYLPNGFSFTTTITLILLSHNQTIRYEPINYFKRIGRSKISPLKDTVNFILLILRTIMFFNPIKVFLPVGFFFILLSVVVLIFSSLLGRVMDITTNMLFFTGIQIISLGLVADLINKRLG
jgi:glycosyltransferase involved in cell wall biosynthesis